MSTLKIKALLKEQYGLVVNDLNPMTTGVGGDTYLVSSDKGRFVLKFADVNEMNRPELEPDICSYLVHNQIPASEFVRNISGGYITLLDGRIGHLQKYIAGDVLAMNTSPDWFMEQSAELLAKIHQVLLGYETLPDGIGQQFFEYMTMERANQSYRQSLEIARKRNDESIIEDLEFRIHLTESLPSMKFDLDALTYRNTHGDYTVNQILCVDSKIQGIIDWTSACRHPVVWELTRSFFYADPACKDGDLDDKRFQKYVDLYCERVKLNDYDRKNILRLYYYQLAVCDYYSQYLFAEDEKKEEYLMQAKFATNVLRKQKNRV